MTTKMPYHRLFLLFCTMGFALSVWGQPKISFSFDDGMTADRPGYPLEVWNGRLLETLRKNKIASILFVAGKNKSTKKGRHILRSWNDAGHLIANHTTHHPNYSSPECTYERFADELRSNDSLIQQYSNYAKWFRFPYLKEGDTPEKVDLFRSFLKDMGYRNGYVTIDASDWYIDSRLVKRLRENPQADLSAFRDFYLDHIWERAQFYEKLSFELTQRHIGHTLLLHHNLAAALFLDDLVRMFQDRGWQIISTEEAYADPIFEKTPNYAGESLIYALAKDSGRYEDVLRYPAEDSRYEEKKMNDLGL